MSATLLLTASVFLFSHPLQFIWTLPHHNCYLQYPHMLGGEADILPTSIWLPPSPVRSQTSKDSDSHLTPLLSLSAASALIVPKRTPGCLQFSGLTIISHYSYLLTVNYYSIFCKTVKVLTIQFVLYNFDGFSTHTQLVTSLCFSCSSMNLSFMSF